MKRIKQRAKAKYKCRFYRDVFIEVNSVYTLPGRPVVVHTPDIERYFRSTAGVRRVIDQVLASKTYTGAWVDGMWMSPDPNEMPF